MRRAREAVDAAVLAATIGIDARLEADVGAVVVRDDGARRIAQEQRVRRRLLLRLLVANVLDRLEPILRVPGGAAAVDRLAHIASTAVPTNSPARRSRSASF